MRDYAKEQNPSQLNFPSYSLLAVLVRKRVSSWTILPRTGTAFYVQSSNELVAFSEEASVLSLLTEP